MVTVGGPILGGALADAGLWRMIFFINIPIGITSLIILWRKVPESSDEETDHSLDYAGSLAIVAGLALLTYGFLKIPKAGFNNWQVYVSIAAGILSLIIFIIIEKKSKHPMMPLQLFSNKTFSGANLLDIFFICSAFLCYVVSYIKHGAGSGLQPVAGRTYVIALHNFTHYYFKMVGWPG